MSFSRVYTVHGIILSRRNVGEADRIVTLFSKEQGKIRVIAKGIRKITSKRAAHLEVFREVFITLHKGKSLDSVTEVKSTPLLENVSIQKISFAYYLCELVDRLLPEREEQEGVFQLTITAFHLLNKGNSIDAWQQHICTYALELLWLLGYLPRTTRLSQDRIAPYVEHIIERKLRTPVLLTKLQ